MTISYIRTCPAQCSTGIGGRERSCLSSGTIIFLSRELHINSSFIFPISSTDRCSIYTAEATLIALNNSWAKIAFHLLRAQQIIEKLLGVLRNSPWFSKGPYKKLPATLIRTVLIYFSNAYFTHTSTGTRLALEPVEMESVQK